MRPVDWVQTTALAPFRRAVLRWYRAHGRSLPWRGQTDPYRVWVSEIMLQQTTVATVIGYYDRFLERFPDVAALAAAPEADVLHAWQGLGYYRRARHLHAAAKVIAQDHGGLFPRDLPALLALPGMGNYTARAVASITLGQRAGILEANTIRLWTRICAASGDPARSPLKGELWELVETVLPAAKETADFNQAVMDLGAMICKPRDPDCPRCPVREFCHAAAAGDPTLYPQLAPKREKEEVDHLTCVIWSPAREVLVCQRPAEGRWGNLWEFPRVERLPSEDWDEAAERLLAEHGIEAELGAERLTVRHAIMHYRVRLLCLDAWLKPSKVGTKGKSTLPRSRSPGVQSSQWLAADKLSALAFSSPQRKLVASVLAAAQGEEPDSPRTGGKTSTAGSLFDGVESVARSPARRSERKSRRR